MIFRLQNSKTDFLFRAKVFVIRELLSGSILRLPFNMFMNEVFFRVENWDIFYFADDNTL